LINSLNALWIVLPSSNFEAAFPVGATQIIFCSACPIFFVYNDNSLLIVLITKVLPVPGPPEIMLNLFNTAFFTAFFWGRWFSSQPGKNSSKNSSIRVSSMGGEGKLTLWAIFSTRRFWKWKYLARYNFRPESRTRGVWILSEIIEDFLNAVVQVSASGYFTMRWPVSDRFFCVPSNVVISRQTCPSSNACKTRAQETITMGSFAL